MGRAQAERYRTETARLAASVAWRPSEAIFWLVPIAAYFLFPTHLALLAQVAIMGLFALSLDLLLGFAGIISLGHAAFFGLGGFVAGILAQRGWSEPLSGLAIAGAVAGAAGLATSFLVLRGSDLTRLMVTLGISLMLLELANEMAWLTGGADGLQGVTVAPVLGLWDFDLHGRTAYLYSVAVLFLSFLVIRRVAASPFGLVLRGIKENRRRMSAIGTPVARGIVAIYTLAAVFAGLAGALLTQTTQFVSLDVLGFDKSAQALLMVVLGGTGTLYGALIGALALMTAQQFLSGITPEYWQFWMGLCFMALALFARGGIIGLVGAARAALRRCWSRKAAPVVLAPEK